MKEEAVFFIDTIGLMPENSVLFIQAPSLESEIILSLLNNTQFVYYKSIILNSENKKVLIEEVISDNVQREFQSIEIRDKEVLLFEAYDGVEFGIISKHY